jgi:hypothetical protein
MTRVRHRHACKNDTIARAYARSYKSERLDRPVRRRQNRRPKEGIMRHGLRLVTGGLVADLLATFDDDSTASCRVVDPKKGSITPAS